MLGTLIGWGEHRRDIANYLAETTGAGAGAATPLLVVVKVVELLLLLTALAGLLRRRDVWMLPALLGWMAGFAVFCVLDLWAGLFGRLAEHVLYLLVLAALLAMSYTLSIKVRMGRPSRLRGDAGGPAPKSLTRTQEMALAAINRWQRGDAQNATSGPPRAGSA
jgi:hypothetical protein